MTEVWVKVIEDEKVNGLKGKDFGLVIFQGHYHHPGCWQEGCE